MLRIFVIYVVIISINKLVFINFYFCKNTLKFFNNYKKFYNTIIRIFVKKKNKAI